MLAILLCAKAWQITFFYFTLNNLWVVFKYDNLSFFCCNSAGNLMMNVEPLIISIVSYHVNSKLYLVVFFFKYSRLHLEKIFFELVTLQTSLPTAIATTIFKTSVKLVIVLNFV